MRGYPEIQQEAVHSIKRVGELCVVTLEAPKGADKEGMAETFQNVYERTIAEPHPEKEQLEAGGSALLPTRFASTTPAQASVFVSYAHEDAELLQQFSAHAAPLKREALVTVWDDRRIPPASEWKSQIDDRLRAADLILLFVTADFVASDYCYQGEMDFALKRHAAGEAKALPIIVRPCDWQGLPFGGLQSAPRGAQAVTSWPNRDEAWTDVVRHIRRAVADLQEGRRIGTATSRLH